MNNSSKLWFKRKWYGWGWTPSTWEGWLSIGIYVLALIVGATLFHKGTSYTVFLLILSALLVLLAYKKGETPRWQWGKPKK